MEQQSKQHECDGPLTINNFWLIRHLQTEGKLKHKRPFIVRFGVATSIKLKSFSFIHCHFISFVLTDLINSFAVCVVSGKVMQE